MAAVTRHETKGISLMRIRRLQTFVLACTLAFIAGPGHTFTERWVSSSPSSSRAAVFASTDANTLFVGSYGGLIYKSTDGGLRFFRSSNGLPAQGINQLARNLAVSPTLFVATDGSGVFKSTDLGTTWVDASGTGGGTLSCWFINDIATTESDPNRLYAVSSCTAPSGLFRSTDGGANWSAALTGAGVGQMPVGTDLDVVSVDPSNADVVYAIGATTGIWKSVDGGLTWAQINNGLSGGAFGSLLRTTRVRINSTTPSVLYVSVRGSGPFLSTNGGSTWTSQNAGLPSDEALNLGIDRVNPDIVYVTYANAGVFKGVRSGSTISWSALAAAPPGTTFVSTPAADPTVQYVGTFAGFFKSTDGGASYTELKIGLPPSEVNVVKSDPLNASIVYATSFESLYKSTDGGINWTRKPIPNVTLRSSLESQLALDPVTPGTLYLATFGNGIFKSTNGGDTFTAVNSGLPANLIVADAVVAIAPTTPATLYAGFFDGFSTRAGFFKTTNGGALWVDLTANLPVSPAPHNANSRRVRSIYVDPTNANVVWVLTANGPYKTVDGGVSFTLPGPAYASARSLAFDPGNGLAVWLGRNNNDAFGNPNPTTSGVFASTDGGVNYTQKLGSFNIQRIALTRNGGNVTIYGSAFADDILNLERSNDGGATWFNDSVGLVSDVVRSFDVDAAQTALRFLGGQGIGVARKSILPYGPDYNRNGRADVFWRNANDGSNVQWFMDGPNLAGFAFQDTVPQGAGWSIVAQADFDGDGKTDLLWRNSVTGQNLIWFMDGGVRLSAQSPPSVGAGQGWIVAGVGDFDCDGKADIFWRNTSSGLNTIWFMNGATRSSFTFVPTVPTSYTVVGVADINGDCKADVFWREAASGTNASWLMDGATVSLLTFYVTVPPAAGWTPVGLADFNGDGKADLLWRNANGTNLIWFLNGATLVGSASPPFLAPGQGWEISSIGDFDGDGIADLFWRNSTDGLNTIWFMNGATRRFSAFQPTVLPSSGWEIQKY
ncbi:MAG: FG-GAP-like repeat-containing protein [Casimicrobiaceae bacterium]